MYSTILLLHSWFRWLVLISLVFAIYRGYRGWKLNKSFSKFDDRVRQITAIIAQLQLKLGIVLYTVSPTVRYFLSYFKTAVHQREIRFFGMEHVTMMLIAVVVITIGSIRTLKQPTGQQQYKTMAVWYTIALVIIFTSIPWQFSPLISRPYFRTY